MESAAASAGAASRASPLPGEGNDTFRTWRRSIASPPTSSTSASASSRSKGPRRRRMWPPSTRLRPRSRGVQVCWPPRHSICRARCTLASRRERRLQVLKQTGRERERERGRGRGRERERGTIHGPTRVSDRTFHTSCCWRMDMTLKCRRRDIPSRKTP